VEKGELDPALGGRLGYLLNILTRVMEIQHQQNKVETLSERLDELEDNL
jgi:hypothetical protein